LHTSLIVPSSLYTIAKDHSISKATMKHLSHPGYL
jgi:hypothetical protein